MRPLGENTAEPGAIASTVESFTFPINAEWVFEDSTTDPPIHSPGALLLKTISNENITGV